MMTITNPTAETPSWAASRMTDIISGNAVLDSNRSFPAMSPT